MTREEIIQSIEGLYPADSDDMEIREIGIALVGQADNNYINWDYWGVTLEDLTSGKFKPKVIDPDNWREFPFGKLLEYARLCEKTKEEAINKPTGIK